MREVGGEGSRRQLMRLLHGELPLDEARELRLRLTEDPELQREYRDLKATWDRLALPEPRRTPPGFARQVVSKAIPTPVVAAAATVPRWLRIVAVLALPVGVALGVGIGLSWPHTAGAPAAAVDAADPASLDVTYWLALGEDEREIAGEEP